MPTVQKVSAKELLLELKSFCKIEESEIERAGKSGIDTTNNSNLRILLRGWVNGKYDEDPFALVHEINTLVKKGNNGKSRK